MYRLTGAATAALMCLMVSTFAQEPLSYSAYHAVLRRYVNDKGMVDYESLKLNREKLDQFVNSLGSYTREAFAQMTDREQIAFWINAYNGLTLRLIIDHYPITPGLFRRFVFPNNSIRQIPGAWDGKTFTVMGESMTLDHIEHDILRVDYDEPRIHFALVCASMGCARLARTPYRGEYLDSLLDAQTRLFLDNPEKFRIDREKKIAYLSAYFDWYGEDFVPAYLPEKGYEGFDASERASLHFIAGYVDEREADWLRDGDYRIEYLPYDWSLNEQR